MDQPTAIHQALGEPARLAALARTCLLDVPSRAAFQRLAELASEVLDAPMALVSLVDAERQFFAASVGLPEPWASRQQTPLTHSFCQHEVRSGQPLVVEDAREHPLLSDSLAISDLAVIAYAGIPLRTSEGFVLGSFCVMDSKPRRWPEQQVNLLRKLAASAMTEIELHAVVQWAESHRWDIEQERRLKSAVLESASEGIFGMDREGRATFVNAAAVRMLGYSAEELLGREMHMLIHHRRRHGGAYPEEECPILAAARGGPPCRLDDEVLWRQDGTCFAVEYAASPLIQGGTAVGAVVTFRDVTERKRGEGLLKGQRQVLELIATGAPLAETLDAVTDMVEGQSEGHLCSVLLLDEGGTRLRCAAARSLPDEYNAAIEGIEIGPDVGSCGTAAFTGRRVVVADIATDPRWESYKDVALQHGLEACWSQPILSNDKLLGTVAIYSRRSGEPSEQHLALLEAATHLAKIAIDRLRHEQQQQNLTSLVENSPDFIGIANFDQQVLFLNGAGRRLLGLEGDHEPQRTKILDYFSHEDREWIRSEVIPILLAEGRWDGEVRFRHFKTGRLIPVSWNVFTIPDRTTGAPAYFACVSRDVTERKEAERAIRASEERHRFLSDATKLLTSSLDFDDVFLRLAQIAVPLLGDFCFFDVVGEDDQVRRVAWSHVDPQRQRNLDEVMRLAQPKGHSDDPVAAVIRSGQPQFLPRLTEEWVRRAATSPKDLEVLRALDFHSLISVPLLANNNVLGALTFGFSRRDRSHTTADLELGEELGRRAAIAITKARLYAAEQRARSEAEAANQAKDRFLAVLSHELRTPLSPAVMAIPAMERDPDLPAKFHEDLAMVRRNIDLEVKLIDDLLDVSRVTSGKLRLHLQPIRVHDLLRHVVQSSASGMAGKRLSIHPEFGAAVDRISGDPARLQQVFWNLLRNAIKFTPDGGSITVRTWNAEGQERLFVEVADTGVGIAPEFLPRIFGAFQQGAGRTTTQFGGLGLGLAIAKAVVEMHGGRIMAASGGVDQGALFTVEFRTARGSEVTAVPDVEREGAGQHPSLRCKLLLVEDHADTARTLARLLTQSGYEVEVVHSAASALEIAAIERFDLVVSDIGLPDKTGYELMGQIRDRFGIKGIALSGYGMEEDVRRSHEAGFVDHVVKPVNVAQLEAVIRRVVSGEVKS